MWTCYIWHIEPNLHQFGSEVGKRMCTFVFIINMQRIRVKKGFRYMCTATSFVCTVAVLIVSIHVNMYVINMQRIHPHRGTLDKLLAKYVYVC